MKSYTDCFPGIKLLHTIEGDMNDEKYLHYKFSEYHYMNEWFYYHKKIITEFKKYQAGEYMKDNLGQDNKENYSWSFSKLLQMYYDKEHNDIPYNEELEEYIKYLILTECASLHFVKDKLDKRIEDYKKLEIILINSNFNGFVTSKEIKEYFKKEFKKYKMSLLIKANLIKYHNIYDTIRVAKKINRTIANGYKLTKNNI